MRRIVIAAATLGIIGCSDAVVSPPAVQSVGGQREAALTEVILFGSLTPSTGPTTGGNVVTLDGNFPLTFVAPTPACLSNPSPSCIMPVMYAIVLDGEFVIQNQQVTSPTTIEFVMPPRATPGTVQVQLWLCHALCFLSVPHPYTYVLPNEPPVADAGGPYSGVEGSSISFAGSGSDPESQALTFEWQFGDGSTATGASASHAYSNNGTYIATLTVRDSEGATATATTSVVVANAAPTMAQLAGDDIPVGDSYTLLIAYADAGLADTHDATIAWGDGSTSSTAVSGGSAALAHAYSTAGTFTVSVTVTDNDGGAVTGTAVVMVRPASGTVAALEALLAGFTTDGSVSPALAGNLSKTIDKVAEDIAAGKTQAATGKLGAFINKVEAAVLAGKLSASTGTSLLAAAQAVINTL